MTTTTNTEYERKYTINLPAFYHWAQPFITRGLIQTRVIKQWYIPEEIRKGGVVRIRQVIRGHRDVESVELTIKVPTNDPAIRSEFTFRALADFNVDQFVDVLGLQDNVIVKDRWDVTSALGFGRVSTPTGKTEVIVDFFGEKDGSTTAVLETENAPADWEWPSFIAKEVTADMSFTNFARARDSK